MSAHRHTQEMRDKVFGLLEREIPLRLIAARLGISIGTIRRWKQEGRQIPATKRRAKPKFQKPTDTFLLLRRLDRIEGMLSEILALLSDSVQIQEYLERPPQMQIQSEDAP